MILATVLAAEISGNSAWRKATIPVTRIAGSMFYLLFLLKKFPIIGDTIIVTRRVVSTISDWIIRRKNSADLTAPSLHDAAAVIAQPNVPSAIIRNRRRCSGVLQNFCPGTAADASAIHHPLNGVLESSHDFRP